MYTYKYFLFSFILIGTITTSIKSIDHNDANRFNMEKYKEFMKKRFDSLEGVIKKSGSNTLKMNYNTKLILKMFKCTLNHVSLISIVGILATTYYMRYKKSKEYQLLIVQQNSTTKK